MVDVAVPYCDGVPERDPTETSCASDADCPSGLFCMVEMPDYRCSGVTLPPEPQPSACGDAGCPAGTTCFSMARSCVPDGSCEPSNVQCPEGFVCEAQNPGAVPM